MRGQFEKQDDMNYTVQYDFSSVMQYPQWAFSRDVHDLNTIITKDPFMQLSLGGDELTFRDKKLANAMYDCSGEYILNPLAIRAVCGVFDSDSSHCADPYAHGSCLRQTDMPTLHVGGVKPLRSENIEISSYLRRLVFSVDCLPCERGPSGIYDTGEGSCRTR